jgi:hypothetical protein
LNDYVEASIMLQYNQHWIPMKPTDHKFFSVTIILLTIVFNCQWHQA